MSLLQRCAAAQATLDRYLDKTFRWGTNDCVHLVNFCLRELGLANQLKGLRYTSYKGARTTLKALGAESLEDILDKRFERIAPAAALIGDIVALAGSQDEFAGLGIALNDGRVLGFMELAEHPEEGAKARIADGLTLVTAAWRSVAA